MQKQYVPGWSQRAAHLLLQLRTRVLDEEWKNTFRRVSGSALDPALPAAFADMEYPKHWWLRTPDIRSVFTDQKGNYRLKWEPGYVVVEYTEGKHPEVDKEKWGKEISGQLGMECHWVFQPKHK